MSLCFPVFHQQTNRTEEDVLIKRKWREFYREAMCSSSCGYNWNVVLQLRNDGGEKGILLMGKIKIK